MKTIFLTTATLFIVFSNYAQLEDTVENTREKQTVLKINAASIFRQGIEGSIEKTHKKRSSYEIAVGVESWSNKTSNGKFDSISQTNKYFQSTLESFKLYQIRGQWNYYLITNKNEFSGLYLGPYAKISGGTVEYKFITQNTIPLFGKENNVVLESSLMSIAVGGNIGYQVNINKSITLGAFVQLGYKTGKVSPYYENKAYENEYSKKFTPHSVKGFDNNVGINLGIVL